MKDLEDRSDIAGKKGIRSDDMDEHVMVFDEYGSFEWDLWHWGGECD